MKMITYSLSISYKTITLVGWPGHWEVFPAFKPSRKAPAVGQ
ncbi:hypothetical protein KKC1_31700 [Calderihabitans maritimus]|uniref:Uncharacterized protein n=1 Tax=Calderihabitans maritimus TaxID=1246530 RepID=A0A1Z5HWZ0_9FIRM|nr:hypothetical protein KKC1_31700 [Calderihabitans maritimus]